MRTRSSLRRDISRAASDLGPWFPVPCRTSLRRAGHRAPNAWARPPDPDLSRGAPRFFPGLPPPHGLVDWAHLVLGKSILITFHSVSGRAFWPSIAGTWMPSHFDTAIRKGPRLSGKPSRVI